MDIHLDKKNGHHQFYAAFDFRIITGVMRFEKPLPAPKSDKTGASSNKRKWEEVDEEGNVNMDDLPSSSSSNEKYTEKNFHLGATDNPTARRPTWRYRWRGEETGEGGIQLNSDKVLQQITFSEKGNQLSGTFKCDYAGECHFTGVKRSGQP